MYEYTKTVRKNFFLLIYTMIFILLFTVNFCWFVLDHKTLFRSYDGLDQHYTIFLYIGKWIREILHNIFAEHKIEIPLWDMSIGYGSDIITTLCAYLPDPFNWISAFTPPKYAEYVFNFIIILKFYISGLSYSCYAFYKKHSTFPVLCGAIIYTFSASMFIAFIQPFFINPMYIFPILLMGVEKIWNGEKPYVYIFALSFSFFNYFYFAYMMCIFIFFYCCIKYIASKEIMRNWKTFFSYLGKFTSFTLLAGGIAMVVLLPVLTVVFDTGRLRLAHYLPMFYDRDFYRGLLKGIISSSWMGQSDCILGFSVIALLCVFLLFLQREKTVKLKLIFLLLTAGLGIPYIGHVMNGFNYATNRWVWSYCICVSYIVTLMIARFRSAARKELVLVLCFAFCYSVLIIGTLKQFDLGTIAPCILLMICALFFCASWKIQKKYYEVGVIAIIMISTTFTSFFYFNDQYKRGIGSIAEEVQSGTAYQLVMDSGAMPLLKELNIPQSVRYDEYGIPRVKNASWLYGFSGMDMYISIYNNNIDRFHNNLALLTSPFPMGYAGLDRRTELETLAGVQQFLIPKGHKNYLPYGYNILTGEKQIQGQVYQSYTTADVHPIIFSFDKAIGENEYQALSPYERQQALTQACVVPSSYANATKDFLVLPDDKVNYTLEFSNEVTLDHGNLNVSKEGGQIRLSFDEINDSELYLDLTNLNYESPDYYDYSLSAFGLYNGEAIDGLSSFVIGLTNKSHMYGGKHNWLLNLGYARQPVNGIVIFFNRPGVYSLSNFRILRKTENEIQDSIDHLNYTANQIEVSNNRIRAHVSLNAPQYVYFSIPYSSGWTAYVNGNNQHIIKADNAFMALKLEPGEYDIELNYRTPFLILGGILSFVFLGAVLFVFFRSGRR